MTNDKPRLPWSAEIAMLDMWNGIDLKQEVWKIHRYFRTHLQAAYDRGREDIRREIDRELAKEAKRRANNLGHN